MLVVQDLDRETTSLDEQEENEIAILQASELQDDLKTVLLKAVDGLAE